VQTSHPWRAAVVVAAICLVPLFGLAACGGPTNAASSQQATTTTDGNVGAHPKGLSAVNAPTRVSFGTGSIGAADPTTTVPSERGQDIEPGVNPGQNIIIKNGRVYPQTLEASQSAPIVWYNLSSSPQRIIFDDSKYYPIDSGTIPPGGTFSWTAPAAQPLNYQLEPSGFEGKLVVNPVSGGPGSLGGSGSTGGT
jgi:hypothetical protein